jgi:hypothetical protein
MQDKVSSVMIYIHIYFVFRKASPCRETEVDFGEAGEKAAEKLSHVDRLESIRLSSIVKSLLVD